MFRKKVDLGEFILGVLLAVLILYLFWRWIENGYSQWDVWDRSNLTLAEEDEKNKKLKYFMVPNRWLSDTYPMVRFWNEYYKALYF